MKESKYNIYIEYKGKQIVFNSRTIATAVLDTDEIDILNAVQLGKEIKEHDLLEQMRQVGFLVGDEVDELQQLEISYNLCKYQNQGWD